MINNKNFCKLPFLVNSESTTIGRISNNNAQTLVGGPKFKLAGGTNFNLSSFSAIMAVGHKKKIIAPPTKVVSEGNYNRSSALITAETWKKKATNILNLSPSEIKISASEENLLNTHTQAKGKAVKSLKIVNQKLLNKSLFNKFWILCKESRIESQNRFYGSFYIGPFDESLSQTLAHNIRRTLLSELSGLAITSVEIDGVLHKFSNLPGIQETVLDILCNLQNIVFCKDETYGVSNIYNKAPEDLQLEQMEPKQGGRRPTKKLIGAPIKNNSFKKSLKNTSNLFTLEQVGYLRVRGPGVIRASDLILPAGLKCVNPDQHIATLAEDGILNMKIFINEGKNYIKQKQKNTIPSGNSFFDSGANTNLGISDQPNLALSDQLSRRLDLQNNFITKKTNRIYLDSVFMPVTKVNTIVQNNEKCTELETAIISSYNGKVQNINLKTTPLENGQKSTEYLTFFKILNPIKTPEAFNANTFNLKKSPQELYKTTNWALKSAQTNLISSEEERSASAINVFSEITQKQQKKQCHIVLEIWTNGSLHPRQALYECLGFLSNTFITLENVKMLGSMFKSDYIYNQVLEQVQENSGLD